MLYNIKGKKTRGQFHQHFTLAFFAEILLPKNYGAKFVTEKSCAKHFHTKNERKNLMKSTPEKCHVLFEWTLRVEKVIRYSKLFALL